MALSFAQLFPPKQISNAAPDTLFTIGANPSTGVLRNGRVRFANTTAAPVTVKAWAVPSAGTAADGNVIYPMASLNANSFVDVDLPFIAAGGFVQAQAGAATSITASFIDGFIQS